MIDFLRDVFQRHGGDEAIVWRNQSFTYEWLLKRLDAWRETLAANRIAPGSVVAMESDFSPEGVALFLALTEHACVLVPLTASVAEKKPEFRRIAEVEVSIAIDGSDRAQISRTGVTASHELFTRLRERRHPGLVLFSSGSTGESKGAVHDLAALIDKYRVQRRQMRTITFLLYDHIGGVNTMFHTLANGGCLITLQDRSVDTVLQAVERHRAELLPTSPTFINLVLLSDAASRYRLEPLKTVTYGTEPMPESTLRRFHALYPHINLQQTYGLSEVGILRSKSKDSESLWVKLGGEGFETRVVDGILHIKAKSAMLGYLNAPSPFTEDGWLDTGDLVETDGEYFRILGRQSELINVGGEKVYPAEVESVLLQMPNVNDAAVTGETNPIVGQIVVAHVVLREPEEAAGFKRRMREFCRGRLAPYKTPARVDIVETDLFNQRFKKIRRRPGLQG